MIVELDILTLLGAKTRYKFAIFDLANPDRPKKLQKNEKIEKKVTDHSSPPEGVDLTLFEESKVKNQSRVDGVQAVANTISAGKNDPCIHCGRTLNSLYPYQEELGSFRQENMAHQIAIKGGEP